MPHPKGNVKLSGDTHLPDAESDLELEEGASHMADLARERTQSGRRATHARKAGVLTAGDETGAIGAVMPSVDDDGTSDEPAASQRPQQAKAAPGRALVPVSRARRVPDGRASAFQPIQASSLALLGAGALALLLVAKLLR
jgi:hypothetical protein